MIAPGQVVERLWRDAGLDPGALARLHLTGCEPVLPSSFRVGTAAQASLAAAALASAEIGRLRPGIVYASLSAYGRAGPWSAKRGFDSLVQTATGFNLAEAEAAGAAAPKALPMQTLDTASGFLLAFGIAAALLRQRREGGRWQVEVSLARTGLWLRGLGRNDDGFTAPAADFAGHMEASESGFGRLVALKHAATFSATPALYARPAMPPGSHALAWSA